MKMAERGISSLSLYQQCKNWQVNILELWKLTKACISQGNPSSGNPTEHLSEQLCGIPTCQPIKSLTKPSLGASILTVGKERPTHRFTLISPNPELSRR
jgi:hypothetical protein